jgi:citrate synthase
MSSEPLKTAVSWAEADRILIRGYRLRDLIGRVSLGQAVYLLLVGELPQPKVGQMMEAILVSTIAHSPAMPASRAAITVASSGASLSAAVAAGMLAITRYHGAAIEDAMTVLEECVAMGLDPFEAATEIVARYRSRALRIPGFGSKAHQEDPRVARLLEYAREIGIEGPYIEHVKALQRAVSIAVERHLPLNIDGAIAALLCEMRFPKQAANGLFLISRVAGLVAHAVEAQSRYKPLEAAGAVGVEYDGPPERPFE